MSRLCTFGIVAHIDAGKTTLTERILHDAGAQAWVGSVDDGTATTDWLPEEKARGISIAAAATRVEWSGHVLQIVDTPGHVDFVAEVERCLHVLDGVVVVLDGVRGVESQTEMVWQQAAERGLPRLAFINKLDRAGADFAAVLADLRERLGCHPVPVVIPLADGRGAFAGLGDVLTGAVQWFGPPPEPAVVDGLRRRLAAAHDQVVEAIADVEEAVLAEVVAGRAPAVPTLRQALRRAVLAGRILPVCAGAALWNRGIDWLLDSVVAYLPAMGDGIGSPLWGAPRAGDPTADFAGLVFKVHRGAEVWNFVRVVRGRLVAGAVQRRSRQGIETVPVHALWQMQADRHHPVTEAGPGEIVVIPGDLGLRTGDTLWNGAPLVLPQPHFPLPVLAVNFEPVQAVHVGRLAEALRRLAADDPTLRVEVRHGQVVVHGMGELHLDVVAERLKSQLEVPFACSKPRVDRRETVGGDAAATAEVRAVVAGEERTAACDVVIRLGKAMEPAGLVVEAAAAECQAALAEDLGPRLVAGDRDGPMVGFEVRVGGFRGDGRGILDVLLQQAAHRALGAALDQARRIVLEPWVALAVGCPEDCLVGVMADLSSRGASIAQVSSGRLGGRVRGRAPLARMLGYVTRLRSITKGLGTVSLRPEGYAPTGSTGG